MKRIRLGGVAAGLFAAGLVTGLAGTAIARDGVTSTTDCDAHMAGSGLGAGMTEMMSMMGGSMMGGSMMGDPGASMGPGMMGGDSGPGGPLMPGSQHEQHHPQATPETLE